MFLASALPNSTPHWSNDPISQTAPGAVSFRVFMRDQPVWRALFSYLFHRLAECQGFRLREFAVSREAVLSHPGPELLQ